MRIIFEESIELPKIERETHLSSEFGALISNHY